MAKMIIGGEPAESNSGQWIEVRNPATGEVVDRVPKGTVEDVHRAVAAAEKALPAWSALPTARRGEILHKAVELVRAHEDELARLLTQEQGKPLARASEELVGSAIWFQYTASLQIPVEVVQDDENVRIVGRPAGVGVSGESPGAARACALAARPVLGPGEPAGGLDVQGLAGAPGRWQRQADSAATARSHRADAGGPGVVRR